MSSLYPEMRFSWEIKSVDALFCNGLTRLVTSMDIFLAYEVIIFVMT